MELTKSLAGVRLALLATVLASTVCAPAASASAQPVASTVAGVQQALAERGPDALGTDAYACAVLIRDARGESVGVDLRIAQRTAHRRAENLVRRIGGSTPTTVTVIRSRYSLSAQLRVRRNLGRWMRAYSTVASVSLGSDPTAVPTGRCPRVVVSVFRSARPARRAARSARLRFGRDRVQVREVADGAPLPTPGG